MLADPDKPNLERKLRGDGVDLIAFGGKTAAAAVAEAAPSVQAKELELFFFAGEPFYLATGNSGTSAIVACSLSWSARTYATIAQRSATGTCAA